MLDLAPLLSVTEITQVCAQGQMFCTFVGVLALMDWVAMTCHVCDQVCWEFLRVMSEKTRHVSAHTMRQ